MRQAKYRMVARAGAALADTAIVAACGGDDGRESAQNVPGRCDR
jgi:hypothetical protein